MSQWMRTSKVFELLFTWNFSPFLCNTTKFISYYKHAVLDIPENYVLVTVITLNFRALGAISQTKPLNIAVCMLMPNICHDSEMS